MERRDVKILRTLALRCANLRSSSANTERIFSIIKLIQGPCRARFSIATIEHIARIKVSIFDNKDIELFGILAEDVKIVDEDEDDDRSAASAKLTKRRRIKLSKLARMARNATQKLLDRANPRTSQRRGSITPRIKQDMLPANLRDHYNKFNDLIDFSIINEAPVLDLEEDPIESTVLVSAEDRYGNILKKFKKD